MKAHSSKQRPALLRSNAMALMLLLLVFAGCGFLGDASDAGASTAPARLTPTTTLDDTAPTAAPRPDWYTDVETDAGFRIDVPGILSPHHSQYINNTSGLLTSWSYAGGPTSSALQRAMLQTAVVEAYSTQITDYNLCHGPNAAPITIGSGIPAWQETDVPPHPTGPAEIYGYARTSLVLHGEAIQFTLEAPAPVDTFFTRYGPIWSHMLASFSPLPNQPISATHPCG